MMPVRLDASHLGTYGSKQTFEPQRQNNSLLFLTGLPALLSAGGFAANQDAESIIALSIDSFPAPKYSNNIIEVPYNNMRVKFAGSMMFEDMDVQLKDFVDSDTAKLLHQWRLCCSNPVNGAVGFAREYKLNGVFVALYPPDGRPDYFRYFQLDGVWLSRLDQGDIDHASDDYLRIIATLTCDRIIPLLALDAGVSPENVGAGSGFSTLTPPKTP